MRGFELIHKMGYDGAGVHHSECFHFFLLTRSFRVTDKVPSHTEPSAQHDPDGITVNEQHRNVATRVGLRYDHNRDAFVDPNGTPVRNRFFKLL